MFRELFCRLWKAKYVVDFAPEHGAVLLDGGPKPGASPDQPVSATLSAKPGNDLVHVDKDLTTILEKGKPPYYVVVLVYCKAIDQDCFGASRVFQYVAH